MAITRIDEGELLLPLYEGVGEIPRWHVFLSRLLRRIRADHIALILRRELSAMRKADTHSVARDNETLATCLGELSRLDPSLLDGLRPNRVYAAAELAGPRDGPIRAQIRSPRPAIDGYGRVMRVSEPGGAGIWFIVSRRTADFSAADSTLMASLAPHLMVMLRVLVLLETAWAHEAIATAALSRAGIAWAAGEMRSRRSIWPASLEPAVSRAHVYSEEVADDPVGASLAVPLTRYRSAVLKVPDEMVMTRKAPSFTGDAAIVLQSQFRLSAKEAHLAIALAQGESIKAAAQRLGLTIETARHYSKLVYSKTGTRGQADLARAIWSGVAILA